MNSQTASRSGPGPPGSASLELAAHAFGAECFGAGDAVGVEHERGGEPCEELRDPVEWVAVGERAVELGAEDRVGV